MPGPGEIVRTKLRIPFVRRELVDRLRLQEQVLRGLEGPLTLITAPAGFGKTTLAAACAAQRAKKTAWLSLDKNDSQIENFLGCLIAALQEADPRLGREANGLLAAGQIVSPLAVLTSLLNDLDETGEDILLVMDDYQFITSMAVHEAAAFLIEHAPTHFHLLVASRSDPPLPVTRLRGRGQATELRLGDLRFTREEAAQFLNGVMGLHLDPASVAALAERTEGWIAGLQMAAISLRDQRFADGFIRNFSGTNRYIMDYLLEEVLAGQPPEIQRFLLRTSVLERLCAPLCAWLLEDGQTAQPASPNSAAPRPGQPDMPIYNGTQSCQQALEHLERTNLFLVPLDEERRWYRYHHLFADLLRLRLEQADPGLTPHLHLRAAEWYEQNDLIIEAIQHASAAADDERVERLIDSHYFEMMNRGEMFWVRFWTGSLSKELVVRRPWLCLYEALNQSWFGQLEEAGRILQLAEQLVEAEIKLRGRIPDTQAMLAYSHYVKSRITAMRGDLPAAIELSQAARRTASADNLTLQIDFCITLGFEYFLLGDFENAGHVLQEMIEFGARLQAVNNPVAGGCLLARMAAYRGRLAQADEILQQALRLIQEPGAQYLGVFGLVEIERARLCYRRNALEMAQQHAVSGLEKLPFWGKVDDTCLAHILVWKIQRQLGREAEAQDSLTKAEQIIQKQGVFSEARREVEAASALSLLENADEAGLMGWLLAHPAPADPGDPFQFQTERMSMVRVRFFIALGRLEQALELLQSLETAARLFGRGSGLQEALVLKAITLELIGKSREALDALLEALEMAAIEGDWGAFFEFSAWKGRLAEQGSLLMCLIARANVQTTSERVRSFSLAQLSRFGSDEADFYGLVASTLPEASMRQPAASPSADKSRLEPPIEPLSQRELEVLRLVAQGKTNLEIARQLVVAPGTVKAHTASIYRKLEAANRTEAASKARLLGLVD